MNSKEISELTKKYLKETDDNIVGVSYGYKVVNGEMTKELAICFTVKEKKPINQIEKDKILPKQIIHKGETFNTDVVEGEYKLFETVSFCFDEHYKWWEYYWNPSEIITPTNRNYIRPIKGGLSTTNSTSMSGSVGTLGFLAIDNDDGSLVGVSNNHVWIDDAFIASERSDPNVITNVKNDIVIQPGGTSYEIGRIKKYAPIRTNYWNKADAAITTIDSSVISNTESWKQEGLTISSPMSFASTSEIDNLLSTDPLLYSSGMRSGAKGELNTKLKVRALYSAVTVPQGYNRQGVPQDVSFENCIQFIASGYTVPSGTICFFPLAAGDSGSALIADIGGEKKIIGLCFAGGNVVIPNPSPPPSYTTACYVGLACRIDYVASELNISAWNGSTPNFSNINNIQEYFVSGLNDNPYVIVNGAKYWQSGLKS